MKLIPLTQGYCAEVSDRDYTRVSKFSWQAQKLGRVIYAKRGVWNGKNNDCQLLHHFVLGVPSSVRLDHRDGDGLNNCRRNLRRATKQQNARGFQRKSRRNTSRFRGVHWDSERKKWEAQIAVNGRSKYIGRFSSELTAARIRDKEAKRLFGSFAHLNFP